MRILAWILQVLILAAGMHLFLRFVRTTRGSRLIRGLFVSVLVGVILLWGLSKSLELEELEHILQGAAGFIVVIFAIVFQPEIRRGIAQLGETSLVGRLISHTGRDTVQTVVKAARAMASRRHGALIAFERESGLNAYVETGTELDSEVRVRLLETLFYPGSALHDGAVIVRKDRVVAAGCFFPLPQEGDLDRSLGTRHRAAMGLTEETDAVVLVVSEETGSISLAREGRLKTNLSADHLDEQLRELLETDETDRKRRRRTRRAAALKGDLAWFAASMVLASGILYLAHQEIRITQEFPVRIAGLGPTDRRPPREGELLVILPRDNWRLLLDDEEPQSVQIEGTRAQIDSIGPALSGVLEIGDDEWSGGDLRIEDVTWLDHAIGTAYSWQNELPPNVEVERYGTRRMTIDAASLTIDKDELDPRFEVYEREIEGNNTVTITGPELALDDLGAEEAILEPIVLGRDDLGDRRERLGLTSDLMDKGFQMEGEIVARVSIRASERIVGSVAREVALVCLAPDRADELSKWKLPPHARTARFQILTAGIIPVDADPGSPGFLERTNLVKRFVEDNLVVFVDVAELAGEGEGRAVPVRWSWRRRWTGNGGGGPGPAGRESLEVVLESEGEILLEDAARSGDTRGDDDDRPPGEE